MMSFSWAARVGDWIFHMFVAEVMLPYYHSAGSHNYSRCGQFYIHHMKKINLQLMKKLQNGAFVRHILGIYNSTRTDMFREMTYM